MIELLNAEEKLIVKNDDLINSLVQNNFEYQKLFKQPYIRFLDQNIKFFIRSGLYSYQLIDFFHELNNRKFNQLAREIFDYLEQEINLANLWYVFLNHKKVINDYYLSKLNESIQFAFIKKETSSQFFDVLFQYNIKFNYINYLNSQIRTYSYNFDNLCRIAEVAIKYDNIELFDFIVAKNKRADYPLISKIINTKSAKYFNILLNQTTLINQTTKLLLESKNKKRLKLWLDRFYNEIDVSSVKFNKKDIKFYKDFPELIDLALKQVKDLEQRKLLATIKRCIK